MRPERPSAPVDPAARERDQLATFLVVMLSLVFGGSFVLFLIFVSLGLFLWVLVSAAGIAVFAAFHYLLWGRASGAANLLDGPAAPDASAEPPEVVRRLPQRPDDRRTS